MYTAASTRRVGTMSVDVLGVQFDDGRIERHITIHRDTFGDDGQMTAEQARQLAAALLNAADELDS